ncbi:MAG: peptidoglycan-binding protein [Oscillospiraceae bacterium]
MNDYIDSKLGAVPPYPGTPLKKGSSGNNVKLMQYDLDAIREYLYPSLQFLKVDGIFGSATQETVMQYQAIKGLKADGIIGQITWNAIVNDFASLPSGATDVYPGIPLSQGSSGVAVINMQTKIDEITPTYTAIKKLAVDGHFGQSTADATRLFQKQFALVPDEVIGEETWYAIVGVRNNTVVGNPDSVSTKYPGTPVQMGSSGDSVRYVQSYMNTVGIKLGGIYPTVTIDGQFGQLTKNLVINFQKHFCLKTDGIVGSITWSKMVEEFNELI